MRSVLNIHWKDWCWSWNSNTLATWCKELTRLKRLWCWERLRAGGEVGDRGLDGWMASPTRWTWVWVNSRCWWRTGKPGLLQSMGLQRVRQDWVTELKILNYTNIMQYFLKYTLLNTKHLTLLGMFSWFSYTYAHILFLKLFSLSVQFSRSVMCDSATPWIAACQASLSITNSPSSLRLMSIKLVMASNYLILCRPLLLLPSIFPSIRVFSNESALRIRWPKYWSFSFSISPSNEIRTDFL